MPPEERERLTRIINERNYQKMIENTDFSTTSAIRKARDNKFSLFSIGLFFSISLLFT